MNGAGTGMETSLPLPGLLARIPANAALYAVVLGTPVRVVPCLTGTNTPTVRTISALTTVSVLCVMRSKKCKYTIIENLCFMTVKI